MSSWLLPATKFFERHLWSRFCTPPVGAFGTKATLVEELKELNKNTKAVF